MFEIVSSCALWVNPGYSPFLSVSYVFPMTESVVTSLVLVVARGIAAQRLAWRLKVPAAILFEGGMNLRLHEHHEMDAGVACL